MRRLRFLRLSAELQESFEREYAASALWVHRRALLLAGVLFVAFGALDSWLAPGARDVIWRIRGVVVLALLGALALTYRNLTPRVTRWLLMSVVVIMGAAFMAMIALSWQSGGRDYSAVLVPLILYAYGLVRLPFVTATTLGLLMVLAYGVTGWVSPGSDTASVVSLGFVLVFANLLGMLAAYSRDKSAQYAFLQRHRLAGALRREREAAAALERSEQRTRQLVDSMNEGLVTVDANGRMTWMNRSLCEMTGYAPEDLVGHLPTEFLDEANREVFRREFGSRSHGEKRRYAMDWIHRDGRKLHWIIAPQPTYAADGEFTGSIAVVNDITAIRQAEEALARSERYFRELVDHAQSIILRWDVNGTIRFINPFGLRLLGYTAEEIVGRNVIGTIVPETDSSGKNLVDMIHDITVHPDRYLFNENENLNRNGARFWIVWTNRALTNAEGGVTEILSIGTDITELKKAREEIARQRDALADLNQFIRSVFGRYVSDAVVDRLLASPEGLEVGGTRRCVTILVADIRGFSSLCQDLRPEEVVALLNTYLETMTGVIEQFDGTIDEFIGDGILVIFGAPIAADDHAERAVACGLAMQNAMQEVNARNGAAGLPAVEIGIGIETGEVVVGNIGSVRRAKYGVVGTPVNMAARIEAYTVGGQVMISESTRADVASLVHTGQAIRVEPKGSKHPISLYEVSALDGPRAQHLEGRSPQPELVAVEIPASLALYDDKFATGNEYAARVVRASHAQLEIECSAALPRLANVRLTLGPVADGPAVDGVYAKVVETGKVGACRYLLTLTSTPPAARRYLERLVRADRPRQRRSPATRARAHA
jgi:adenylate cyclase